MEVDVDRIAAAFDRGDDADEAPIDMRPGPSPTTLEREESIWRWREENAEALADYDRFVAEHGILLAEHRTFE